MSFKNIIDLYSVESCDVLFYHVDSGDLLSFANDIEKFRLEIQNRYDNDEQLLEILQFLRRIFIRIITSLLPYNRIISQEKKQEVIKQFFLIKTHYPELFSNIIINLAKSFKEFSEKSSNTLKNCLCKYINDEAEVGLKIAIVTKKSISSEEKQAITHNVKSFLKLNYFTENSFRKDVETFDNVIYLGSPQYFGEFAKNTFKGKKNIFMSYDIFTNSIEPKKIFNDIANDGAYSTIFEKVTIGKFLKRRRNINIEIKESQLSPYLINKFIEDQNNSKDIVQDAVEASILYLENDRFLFAPINSKIRIFDPNEKCNFVKQVNFKDIIEDDFIIIRNDRDTKLIAEIADQDILKTNAKNYRNLQQKWKKKLRYNVQKKGLKCVSNILINRYGIRTASVASVRSWCNDDSICPTELQKLLKALKYPDNEIKRVYKIMKKIQLAHRKAGRIITNNLMSELSIDLLNELTEKGYYTFESSKFNGASFNIERIVLIDQAKHLISPHNLMKPFFMF